MRIDKVALPLMLTALGACATTIAGADTQAVSADCKADAAGTLVGMVAPDDAAILGRTGGTMVRRIAPGDPTTRDYRVERVTVTIAEGRIVAASCG
jgi:hypothetical protein